MKSLLLLALGNLPFSIAVPAVISGIPVVPAAPAAPVAGPPPGATNPGPSSTPVPSCQVCACDCTASTVTVTVSSSDPTTIAADDTTDTIDTLDATTTDDSDATTTDDSDATTTDDSGATTTDDSDATTTDSTDASTTDSTDASTTASSTSAATPSSPSHDPTKEKFCLTVVQPPELNGYIVVEAASARSGEVFIFSPQYNISTADIFLFIIQGDDNYLKPTDRGTNQYIKLERSIYEEEPLGPGAYYPPTPADAPPGGDAEDGTDNDERPFVRNCSIDTSGLLQCQAYTDKKRWTTFFASDPYRYWAMSTDPVPVNLDVVSLAPAWGSACSGGLPDVILDDTFGK